MQMASPHRRNLYDLPDLAKGCTSGCIFFIAPSFPNPLAQEHFLTNIISPMNKKFVFASLLLTLLKMK
jgi:hypothetical protein